MKELFMTLYLSCVQAFIPNPHTLNNLTQEQQLALHFYVKGKCNREANAKLNQSQLKQGDRFDPMYKGNKL